MTKGARKTARRSQIVDGVMNALMSKAVFGVIGSGRSESSVAHVMHGELLRSLQRLHRELDPRLSDEIIAKKARECLLWEGDINTTINHIQFLGVQHRPDFIVQIDGIRMALELKRGNDGSCIRNALGQCVVYASQFDFTCCVVVDTSPDRKIKRAYMDGSIEGFVLENLWDHFNVRLGVV